LDPDHLDRSLSGLVLLLEVPPQGPDFLNPEGSFRGRSVPRPAVGLVEGSWRERGKGRWVSFSFRVRYMARQVSNAFFFRVRYVARQVSNAFRVRWDLTFVQDAS
jgi:hypothetical protein